MTNNRIIVSKGFREAGIIEVGGVPDAAEFEEGLDCLQGLYSSFFGNELGEHLETINLGSNGITNPYGQDEDFLQDYQSVYLPTNKRYILNIDSTVTLYLHPNPADGARIGVIDNSGNLSTQNVVLNGNGRKIEAADSVTLNTDSLNREWFYRADLGNWTRIIDINADDVSPLPREFDDLFTTALALRLNPRYGAQTGQELADVLKRIRKQFRARYKQITEITSEPGLYRLPSNRLYWQGFSSNRNTFDRAK